MNLSKTYFIANVMRILSQASLCEKSIVSSFVWLDVFGPQKRIEVLTLAESMGCAAESRGHELLENYIPKLETDGGIVCVSVAGGTVLAPTLFPDVTFAPGEADWTQAQHHVVSLIPKDNLDKLRNNQSEYDTLVDMLKEAQEPPSELVAVIEEHSKAVPRIRLQSRSWLL